MRKRRCNDALQLVRFKFISAAAPTAALKANVLPPIVQCARRALLAREGERVVASEY